jgi:hypothetical protein
MVVMRQYFTRCRPEHPRTEEARSIPADVNYGKTVYLTKSEHLLFLETKIQFGVFSCLFVFVVIRNNRRGHYGDL